MTGSAWLGFAMWAMVIAPVSASELVGAARKNDAGLVTQLLASGAKVNEPGEQGAVALHWAAYHGSVDLVRTLLDAGARVDAVLENGSTPLHLAAHRGHSEVVRLLLERGADSSIRNIEGVTPIGWARRNGRTETVQLLARSRKEVSAAAPATVRLPDTDSASSTVKQVTVKPRGAGFRVQLVAVSSEQRAREVIAQYSGRFEDILRDTGLVYEPVAGARPGLYRVQSVLLPEQQARNICKQLKQRDQSCLVRQGGGR